MAPREKQDNKKAVEWTYPIIAAQKFIHFFQQVKRPNEEQRALLAAAYYTLATQKNITSNRSKMHVNAAITLLKNIQGSERKKNWGSQIAHSYFKRAEILEEKKQFVAAAHDYRQVIEALGPEEEVKSLYDEDRVLLAQASISIADLIVNEEIELEEPALLHPLFYINKALENLAEMSEVDDDIWAIHAYAHQVAAIALSEDYFEESKEAFRVALLMAFKTETVRICPLLADIYTCLGLLYEHQYQECSIQKISQNLLQHSTIYFGLSLLFNPNESDENEEDMMVLESLFEMIYRLLDPYLPSLSYQVVCDLIDALIYTYICVIDKVLPNQALEHQLNQSDTLDTFAQHIYWLVMEAYLRKNPRTEMLEIIMPLEATLELDRNEILAVIQNIQSNNIHYLKKDKIKDFV